MLDSAKDLNDLRAPPGNRLKKLSAEFCSAVAKADKETKPGDRESANDEYVRVHLWKIIAHLYLIRRT